MARRNTPQQDEARAATLARIRRTEQYAEQVRLLFARTVNEILALNKTMPTLDEGVMFSFDDTSEKKRQQVETLLRRLRSAATLVIQKGIQVEWAQANAEADKLVRSMFGKEVLASPQFTAYTQRNTKAMQAFIARSDHGLNLSQRVWRSCRQLRDEMEVAMTVAIGEGESAADMSRKVRQYLNDPDLMFRRFRYKIGEREIKDADGNVVGTEPVYGRKWKKRVIDPDTGRHKWIDYDRDSYRTGAGVYKSSARNAMRVTRTETNIAYRRADHERWQAMDFVIGQRVQLSKNHPAKDICDKLQGDYPKEFKFDGWHPQCFCFVTPITVPPEETQRITEAFLKGEDWRAVRDEIMRGRQITEYPANFKDWVTSHAEDIAAARERGTAPYFVTNNAKVIDGILNPDQAAPAATPATTPAQAKAETLNQLGEAAKAGNLPQEAVDKLQQIAGTGTQEEFERRAATLQAAADRHAARTPKQAEAIRKQWQERGVVRRYGDRILQVMGGISDVDTNALEQALKRGNIEAIRIEAQKLRDIGKQITALNKLDNPLEVARQTSKATAEQINANVTRTLGKMPTDLADRKSKLEFEINWMGGEGKRRYPATYQFAQAAYKKELAFVQRKIDVKAVADSVDDALAFAATSRSKIIKTLASEMRALLGSSSADLATMQAKANELNRKFKQLQPKPKQVQGVLPPQPIANETLQELAVRLGKNMPPTLKNLAKRIQQRIAAGTYSGWTAQEIAEAERIIREVLDNGCYGMNVPRVDRNGNDDVIDKIFGSWFKNQIETGTGKGLVDVAARKKASTTLFGTPAGTAAVDYERYGFLMDRDILAQAKSGIAGQYWSYGDGIQVRFKKDKVIATFTMEDSLGSGLFPSLCSDPKITSFTQYAGRGGKAIVVSTANTRSAVDATRNFACSYIELQYHGKLTLDCVESVFIPKDVVPRLNAGVLDLIRKSGAIIYSEDATGKLIQL